MTTPTLAMNRTEALPSRELALIVSTQLAYGLCWSTFLLLPKFLTTELHASAAQIGFISAIPSLAATIAVPFVGRVIDRVGRRPLILLGAALVSLQSFGFIFVDRIGPLLYVLQLVYGLSFVVTFNAAGTHAADLAPPQRLSQVLGLFGSANIATNAIAPAIGEPLASRFGWQPVFVLAGACGVCAFGLGFRIRDVARPSASAVVTRPGAARALLVRFVACMCGVGAAFAAAFAFYQPFALSLGIREVRGFFVGFAASVVIARLGLGTLPDRFGRRRTALCAIMLYAIAVSAMSRLAPGTLPLFGALVGAAHGFVYPAINAIAIDASDPRERGSVMTYINGGFQLGFTLGVLAFGELAERAGYPALFFTAGAIVASTALCLWEPRASSTAR